MRRYSRVSLIQGTRRSLASPKQEFAISSQPQRLPTSFSSFGYPFGNLRHADRAFFNSLTTSRYYCTTPQNASTSDKSEAKTEDEGEPTKEKIKYTVEDIRRIITEKENDVKDGRKADIDPFTLGIFVTITNKAGQKTLLNRCCALIPALTTATLKDYMRLIDILENYKRLNKALEVFARMKEHGISPDTRMYNSLMEASLRKGKRIQAWNLYDEMIKSKLQPDLRTLNVFLCGSKSDEDYSKTLQMMKEITERGVKFDLITYNSLIRLAVQRQEFDKAFALYKKLQEQEGLVPDVFTLTILLNAYKGMGHQKAKQAALDLWNQFEQKGVTPTFINYNALVSLCLAYDDANKAAELTRKMTELKFRLKQETFHTMIQLFSRTGRLKEALAMVDEMKKQGVDTTQETEKALRPPTPIQRPQRPRGARGVAQGQEAEEGEEEEGAGEEESDEEGSENPVSFSETGEEIDDFEQDSDEWAELEEEEQDERGRPLNKRMRGIPIPRKEGRPDLLTFDRKKKNKEWEYTHEEDEDGEEGEQVQKKAGKKDTPPKKVDRVKTFRDNYVGYASEKPKSVEKQPWKQQGERGGDKQAYSKPQQQHYTEQRQQHYTEQRQQPQQQRRQEEGRPPMTSRERYQDRRRKEEEEEQGERGGEEGYDENDDDYDDEPKRESTKTRQTKEKERENTSWTDFRHKRGEAASSGGAPTGDSRRRPNIDREKDDWVRDIEEGADGEGKASKPATDAKKMRRMELIEKAKKMFSDGGRDDERRREGGGGGSGGGKRGGAKRERKEYEDNDDEEGDERENTRTDKLRSMAAENARREERHSQGGRRVSKEREGGEGGQQRSDTKPQVKDKYRYSESAGGSKGKERDEKPRKVSYKERMQEQQRKAEGDKPARGFLSGRDRKGSGSAPRQGSNNKEYQKERRK